MAQVVAVLAVDVRPLLGRVHLVDAYAGEPLVLALEEVDQADRLAVAIGTMTSAPSGTCSRSASGGHWGGPAVIRPAYP